MSRRLLDSPWPYFAGAGLLLLIAIASQVDVKLPSQEEKAAEALLELPQHPHLNVLFFVIDTLRADRLGSYGHPRDTSPNLDALARHGIRFSNVLSQSSWTKTSMASIWTGTLPANHGINRFDDVLPQEALMPAEIFRDLGYRTAGVWRNGWVAPNFGFDQGFEFYANPRPGRSRMERQSGHPAGSAIDGTDEDVVASVYEFLENYGQERFFLYVHLMDLHQYTYDEDSPEFGNSYSDIYDQSLHWVDRVVAHVHAHLDMIGQLQNTLIVITSDHGEAFQEHGYEGHARNLYGEVVQVPWIIAPPFRLDQPVVVDEPASNLDVWPTLLDLLGLPELKNPDGVSRVPEILAAAGLRESEPKEGVATSFSFLDRAWGKRDATVPLLLVTEGNKRFHYRAVREHRNELYDLEKDPGEHQNLFDPDDPESQRLTNLAREHLEKGESPWGVEPIQVDLDELRLNQLRALGYVIQ